MPSLPGPHPQRWRLEALAKDGHLETECETVEMDAEGGSIGASASEDGKCAAGCGLHFLVPSEYFMAKL